MTFFNEFERQVYGESTLPPDRAGGWRGNRVTRIDEVGETTVEGSGGLWKKIVRVVEVVEQTQVWQEVKPLLTEVEIGGSWFPVKWEDEIKNFSGRKMPPRVESIDGWIRRVKNVNNGPFPNMLETVSGEEEIYIWVGDEQMGMALYLKDRFESPEAYVMVELSEGRVERLRMEARNDKGQMVRNYWERQV